MSERPTKKELNDAYAVMRMIQVQIRYPAELVEFAIRTIVRDELAKQQEEA